MMLVGCVMDKASTTETEVVIYITTPYVENLRRFLLVLRVS